MSNKISELSEEFFASLVSKCLYSECHYGAGIPKDLESEIYNVDFHKLPSGLNVYGVKTVENPRFFRDVVITGEELDQFYEWEEPCYGADAKILKPCIILAHTDSNDRPDTVICQVGYHNDYDYYTVSNRKSIDGTGAIQYLHESGYYKRQAVLDREEVPGENGIAGLIDETIRAIQDFEKLPDHVKKIFMEQLEGLKTKIEAEKTMQPVSITRTLMDKFIQDLKKQDVIVFEGNEESKVIGKVADKFYVVDGKEYRVSCELDDRKRKITDLVDGKLSDGAYVELTISPKSERGEYYEENSMIQIYYGKEGEVIYCEDGVDHYNFKKYKINSNGAFMTSDKRVYHIIAPDKSEVKLNSRELELATLDTATPDQIRSIYNRLKDIVRYQVVDGVDIDTDKYGYIKEKTNLTQTRLTSEDFEADVTDSRIIEGVTNYLLQDKKQGREEKEVEELK